MNPSTCGLLQQSGLKTSRRMPHSRLGDKIAYCSTLPFYLPPSAANANEQTRLRLNSPQTFREGNCCDLTHKRERNSHIRWVCRHRSLQLHSCPSHMKETGLVPNISFSFSFCTATFRFLQTAVLYNITAAWARSSAAVTQPGSMDFKRLFYLLENLSASWKYFSVLLPHKHTYASTYMANGTSPKSFFSTLVA